MNMLQMGESRCIFIHSEGFAQIFRRLRRAKKSRGAAPRTPLDPHPVTIIHAWSEPTVADPGLERKGDMLCGRCHAGRTPRKERE